MATIYADPDVWAPDRLTAERRTQHTLRAITSRGWEQRLGPLAVHMAERRLIRARRLPYATFGLEAWGDTVIRAAPIALQEGPSNGRPLGSVPAMMLQSQGVGPWSPLSPLASRGGKPVNTL